MSGAACYYRLLSGKYFQAKVPVILPAIAGTFTGKTTKKGDFSGFSSGYSRNFYRKKTEMPEVFEDRKLTWQRVRKCAEVWFSSGVINREKQTKSDTINIIKYHKNTYS